MNNPFQKVRLFFNETVHELRRSVWPGRKEIMHSTVIVLFVMLVLSAYIAVVDFSLTSWVSLLTSWCRIS